MEQYIRALCNYEQDNWVALLQQAQFTYNNSMHASSGMTPFSAVYHHDYPMQLKAPNSRGDLKSEFKADAVLE